MPNKNTSPVGCSPIAERPLLGDEVYDRLLSYIVSRKIQPGARLQVDALVREFGVSQTPIRQAFVKLQAQGLVVNRRNIGFSVSPLPSARQFKDMIEFRILIEPFAARLAARLAGDGQISGLRQFTNQMENNMKGGSETYSEFALADDAFHAAIAEMAQNETIHAAISNLQKQMHLFRLQFHPNVRSDTLAEHKKILDAIATKDGQAAFDAMTTHLKTSLDRVEASLGLQVS